MAIESGERSLELRLEALAQRIAALRRKMHQETGADRIEEFGEMKELESRYERVAQRLKDLDQEGREGKAHGDLAKVADDLSATVQDFINWIDSNYQGARPTVRGTFP